jgi:hypothetical protein
MCTIVFDVKGLNALSPENQFRLDLRISTNENRRCAIHEDVWTTGVIAPLICNIGIK